MKDLKSDTDYMGKDKLYHFGVCFALTLLHPIVALLAALYKEIKDENTEGNHWCWWDLLADAIGIIVGLVPWWYLWHWLFTWF